MLVLWILSWLVNIVKSIEHHEITMPCGSGVNLHFITSAAEHVCVLLSVPGGLAHKGKSSIQISGTHQLHKLITVD